MGCQVKGPSFLPRSCPFPASILTSNFWKSSILGFKAIMSTYHCIIVKNSMTFSKAWTQTLNPNSSPFGYSSFPKVRFFGDVSRPSGALVSEICKQRSFPRCLCSPDLYDSNVQCWPVCPPSHRHRTPALIPSHRSKGSQRPWSGTP